MSGAKKFTIVRSSRRRQIILALLIMTVVAPTVVRMTVSRRDTSYSPSMNSESVNTEDVRFNKFSLLPTKPVQDPWCSTMLPLGPTAYQISGSPNATSALCMLRNHTNAVSVVASEDWECSKLNVTDLIAAVGGPPSQPLSDEDGEYWDRLETVIDVQQIRLKRGKELSRLALKDFPLPYRWAEFTVNDVARTVHDEVRI